MSNKAQKNWNAPSLTEHGSVEKLTAQEVPNHVPDYVKYEQWKRVCGGVDEVQGSHSWCVS
jgi:hypothetical protein